MPNMSPNIKGHTSTFTPNGTRYYELNGKRLYVVGPAAKAANAAGYAATMSAKSGALNTKSSYGAAQSTAALTNQGGGNIGFTYE